MKKNRQPNTRREPPWQKMEIATFNGPPDDPIQTALESEPGFIGVFVNPLYQVTYRVVPTDAFGGEDEMGWLAIRRRDSSSVHDWRQLQRVKNDICGEDREAVEIYPAESRLVDTNNQYHLWVFPVGARVPFGYADREVSDITFGKNKQRPFDEPPAGLNEGAQESIDALERGETPRCRVVTS
jgi:hypothetical protein